MKATIICSQLKGTELFYAFPAEIHPEHSKHLIFFFLNIHFNHSEISTENMV